MADASPAAAGASPLRDARPMSAPAPDAAGATAAPPRDPRPGRDVRVLSIGMTRSLWGGYAQADDDSPLRLAKYADTVASYRLIVHSLRRDRLFGAVRVGATGEAVATNGFSRLDSWLRMVARGIRLGRKERFSVIQAQDPLFTGTAAYLVSRVLGLPFSVCVYGGNPFDRNWVTESRLNRVGAPVARWILRRAHGVQVDGSATLRALAGAGIPRDTLFLKPMIPATLEQFFAAAPDAELRRELLGDGRYDRLALFVGRVVPQKSLEVLLAAAARLRTEAPGVRFVVVGDGWRRERLQAQAERMGVADAVLWAGAVPHRDIVRYIASCDLFVLPSRYEGFPRVLMEAAACGRPIVTTRVSGADDAVVDGESGHIVPIGDDAALAGRIAELVRDPARMAAMGQRARAHMRTVSARFTDPLLQAEIWRAVGTEAAR